MLMPKFTAEAALYRTGQFYRTKVGYSDRKTSRVIPQIDPCTEYCLYCAFGQVYACEACWICGLTHETSMRGKSSPVALR